MKSLLREDRKAKTKAYFFKKTEVVFNRKIINFLEKYYKKIKKILEFVYTEIQVKNSMIWFYSKKEKIFINLGLKIEKWEHFPINM